MKNQELILKAVSVHFACNKLNLNCDPKLEDYVGIANDFLRYFLTGNMTPILETKMLSHRYKNKKKLIERYIKLNER